MTVHFNCQKRRDLEFPRDFHGLTVVHPIITLLRDTKSKNQKPGFLSEMSVHKKHWSACRQINQRFLKYYPDSVTALPFVSDSEAPADFAFLFSAKYWRCDIWPWGG